MNDEQSRAAKAEMIFFIDFYVAEIAVAGERSTAIIYHTSRKKSRFN